MELIGSVLMTYTLARFNSIEDFNLAHRLLNKLRFWVPPSEEDVQRIMKPGKTSSSSSTSSKSTTLSSKFARRSNKDKDKDKNGCGSAGKKAGEKLHMTAADRVEQLELKQALVQQGMLLRYRDWPLLDRIIIFSCLAVFMTGWQELYRFAHPNVRLFKIGSLFTGIAAAVALGTLVDLVWKRRASRTATTGDFHTAVAWMTGIVAVIASSTMLLLPKDGGGLMTMTFHLDSVIQALGTQCYSFCVDIVGISPTSSFLIAAGEGDKQCPTQGLTRLLLVVVAAVIAIAHVPSALTVSFAFVHQYKLPGRARGSRLVRIAVYLEPLLCPLYCLTFVKPLGLGLLQDKLASCPSASPPPSWLLSLGTEIGWLHMQVWMLTFLMVLRLVLLRWQLQTYLEYGSVLALYQELHRAGPKPEDIDALGVRLLFQHRFQKLPLICLELVAPLVWLGICLFLLVSKCFLPSFLDGLAASVMNQDAAAAFRSPTSKPLGGSIVSILDKLRSEKGEEKYIDWALGRDIMHVLWGFEWWSASEWADAVGFLAWWSVSAWTGLYLVCIAWRMLNPQMGDR
ncbi:hypothetical protein VYU27_005553 [Nannochloropsis oceanica]